MMESGPDDRERVLRAVARTDGAEHQVEAIAAVAALTVRQVRRHLEALKAQGRILSPSRGVYVATDATLSARPGRPVQLSYLPAAARRNPARKVWREFHAIEAQARAVARRGASRHGAGIRMRVLGRDRAVLLSDSNTIMRRVALARRRRAGHPEACCELPPRLSYDASTLTVRQIDRVLKRDPLSSEEVGRLREELGKRAVHAMLTRSVSEGHARIFEGESGEAVVVFDDVAAARWTSLMVAHRALRAQDDAGVWQHGFVSPANAAMLAASIFASDADLVAAGFGNAPEQIADRRTAMRSRGLHLPATRVANAPELASDHAMLRLIGDCGLRLWIVDGVRYYSLRLRPTSLERRLPL